MNPVHLISPCFFKIRLILFSQLLLILPSGLLPLGSPTRTLYTLLISPVHATCPSHLILHHLIFVEAYTLWRFSLWIFSPASVTSFLVEILLRKYGSVNIIISWCFLLQTVVGVLVHSCRQYSEELIVLLIYYSSSTSMQKWSKQRKRFLQSTTK